MVATKRTRLIDVANAAGVSLSTASKVLNGAPNRVTPATCKRILDAAKRLQFRPNDLARSLANGKSLTVGILTEDAAETFTMPVLVGANRELGVANIASLVYDIRRDPGRLADQVARLQARPVDGVLVVGNGLFLPLQSVTSAFSTPVVYAFGLTEDPRDTSFLPDSRMAGRLAGGHLIGLGRSRIAHVTAKKDVAAAEREKGLRETLEAAGLPLALGRPIYGDWTRDWGVRAGWDILEHRNEVDAVFCGNDSIAAGLESVLLRAGVKVPDDIALVGVDNIGSLLVRPGHLTTVDPRHAELGASAARHLLSAMTNQNIESGIFYQPCVLVPGESTLGDESESSLFVRTHGTPLFTAPKRARGVRSVRRTSPRS